MRWQLLDVPIEELETEEALVDAVTAAVDGARTAADRSIVARVHAHRAGPLHASLAGPGLLADVATAPRSASGRRSRSPGSRRSATGPARPWTSRLGGRPRTSWATCSAGSSDAAHWQARSRRQTVAGDPDIPADLEAVVDDLFGNQRARRRSRERHPARLGRRQMLDEAEAILVDRLGDEG